MKEYEIFIEEMNPCGGEAHCRKSVIEAEAESPEAYVKANGRFPILEQTVTKEGDTVVMTGDGGGYYIRYTFTE